MANGLNLCGDKRFCPWCREKAVNDLIGTIEVLSKGLPLYVIEFSIEEDVSMERVKRNIRLKNPDLLVYLPHDKGTHLITTESRYGGTAFVPNKEQLSEWIVSREGKRMRVMSKNKTVVVEEKVRVVLNEIATPDVHALGYALEIGETFMDDNKHIQEQLQTQLDVAAAILVKGGHVVQRIRRIRYLVMPKTTPTIEKFDLAALKERCHQLVE